MPKRAIWTISPMALIVAFVAVPLLRGQTTSSKAVDDIKIEKWNSTPLTKTEYTGVRSAAAPRRDLSGIWNATGEGDDHPPRGIQTSGADEHRAVLRGRNNPPGGEPDERNIPNSLPYTSLGGNARIAQANRSGSPIGSRSVWKMIP